MRFCSFERHFSKEKFSNYAKRRFCSAEPSSDFKWMRDEDVKAGATPGPFFSAACGDAAERGSLEGQGFPKWRYIPLADVLGPACPPASEDSPSGLVDKRAFRSSHVRLPFLRSEIGGLSDENDTQ